VTSNPPAVVIEPADRTAIIRFNKSAERNPLSRTTLEQLDSAIAASSGASAVVITGTDDVFASGANIRELIELTTDAAGEFSALGQRIFQTIADLPQVTIAAINGYCMGGALDLALACDLRVASSKAVFAHPGARLGIITGWGGTQRLPRIVGRTRALDLFLRARRFDSREAYEMRLVSEIADPVLDHALELARRVANGEGKRPVSTLEA
jgi:enoyl-CoA hydratase